METLKKVDTGDYVVYSDSRIIWRRPVKMILKCMKNEGLSVGCFANVTTEKAYSKRDAFIELGCDGMSEIINTFQRLSGAIVVKKTSENIALIQVWMDACANRRINTDDQNVLGYPNYDGFAENRHDQTAWSLITKKNSIPAFRDPTKRKQSIFGKEINTRSRYPQILMNYHCHLETWQEREAYNAYIKKRLKHLLKRIQAKV